MLNFRIFWGFRGTGTKHTSCAELNWIQGVLSPILMVPNVDSYYSKCCHTQGKAVKMLAAGTEHTAAVTESGKLYGWGWGQYGNLGLGDCCDQMVPVEVVAVNREKIKNGGMWMATHNNSGRVWQSVYIWVEQVWPIGPWELPRSSCSTSSSCPKKQENSKCVCSTAPLFILSCIFLLLFNLVIIRHQSHEEGTKNRYLSCITQRVMGSNLFTDCWRLAAYSCFGQRWPNVWMGLKQGHIKSITYSMHHLPFANCM
jgi:hypothetical protein